jgi:hypothetical protein
MACAILGIRKPVAIITVSLMKRCSSLGNNDQAQSMVRIPKFSSDYPLVVVDVDP